MRDKIVIIIILSIVVSCATGNAKQKQTIIRAGKLSYSVLKPTEYKVKKPKIIKRETEDLKIFLYSRKFTQGDAVYIKCLKKNNKKISKLSGKFLKKSVFFSEKEWGYSGFVGIHPQAPVKINTLSLKYNVDDEPAEASIRLKVRDRKFPVFYRALKLGKFSDVEERLKPDVQKFIKECYLKKREALSQFNSDFIDTVWAHPRDMHYITSPFWAIRKYQQHKNKGKRKILLKSKTRIHYGLDFRGKEGTPVYAMAKGKVVLSQPMYYQGNFVIIDHGQKKYSYYMHMHKLYKEEGDIVQAGEQIGEVGTTGASTGAHLHVSFLINGVHVDPLSLLSLPVRK